MKRRNIEERENLILKLVIENYLKLGIPISSKLISKNLKYKISTATIRNITAKLDEMGLLFQPHTSAGRIPTDEGLKFYVDSLLDEIILPSQEKKIISENFFNPEVNLESLLEKTSRLLSDFSDNLGLVLYPKISKLNFQQVRFLRLYEERILLMLITTSNFIITETIHGKDYFTQDELNRAADYINENFAGKNLLYVQDYLLRELPHERALYDQLISKLITLIKNYFIYEKKTDKIYLEGQANLLTKPELFDMEKLKSLFKSFEEKAKLIKLLTNFINFQGVKVIIGSEMDIPFISGCTLIISTYSFKDQTLGSLGILGPKRMPYKKVISLVDYVAKSLSQTISKVH
ncbi:MAG: heat-inducible transcriptional repressor HrcA [Candidatus Aminicenantia bacterium]